MAEHMPTILLTRPEEASRQFAERLRLRLGDVAVVISPLLEIGFKPLERHEGEEIPIFTSRNGVAGYLRGGGDACGRCWCVGDATAKIARQAGLRPQSAAGDADTLVQAILQSGARGPFVHLRGEHTRGNVAGRLRDAGREVREDVVYAQELRDLTAEGKALLGGELPVIVPLFSPRTAAQFEAVHRGDAPLFVASMSKAIAQALGGVRTVETVVARRPNAPSMIDAAERLFDAAQRLEGVSAAK